MTPTGSSVVWRPAENLADERGDVPGVVRIHPREDGTEYRIGGDAAIELGKEGVESCLPTHPLEQ